MILEHHGSDAGLLEWIRVHSWDQNIFWNCPVNERLDHQENYRTRCTLRLLHQTHDHRTVCNGRPEFCDLRLDQFLFPGSHNSGTGQSSGSFQCAFKNQDLDIVEQLEFGIRFFDVDTIFTDTLGCDGLSTGHGNAPEMGIYQCYGPMSSLLTDMRRWLDNHPSEVVVIDFGNIEYEEETIPELVTALQHTFSAQSTSVKLNSQFKETGSWPTLREAVQNNERIFVFIRDKTGALNTGDNHTDIVTEHTFKPTETSVPEKSEGEASIIF